MRVTSATYERTINLGDYNSEKIGLTVSADPDEIISGEELLKAARESVGKSTTQYLKKKLLEKKKDGE